MSRTTSAPKKRPGYRPAAILLLSLSLLTSGASAFVVDSSTNLGDTFLVTWELQDGATDPNGNTNNTGFDITGTALFEFLGSSGNTMDFELTLSNTTAPNNKEIGLQAFGFATEPDATVAAWDKTTNDASASDWDQVETVDNSVDPPLSNAVGSVIEVQATTGTGANQRLQAGQYDAFQFRLTYANLVLADGVSFTPFAVKYQSDPDSFQFPGGNGGGGNGVPVPGTLALLSLGVLASRRWLRPPAR